MDVLEAIRKDMENGINLLCPNGKRRLCFPVLAAYIADYQEQHVLASIMAGHCRKCTIPAHRRKLLREGQENNNNSSSDNDNDNDNNDDNDDNDSDGDDDDNISGFAAPKSIRLAPHAGALKRP